MPLTRGAAHRFWLWNRPPHCQRTEAAMTRRPALSSALADALLADLSSCPAALLAWPMPAGGVNSLGRPRDRKTGNACLALPASLCVPRRLPPEARAIRHGPSTRHPTVEAKDMR